MVENHRPPRPFSLARDHRHRDAFSANGKNTRIRPICGGGFAPPSLGSRKERNTSSSCALDSREAIIIYLFIGIVYLSCVSDGRRGKRAASPAKRRTPVVPLSRRASRYASRRPASLSLYKIAARNRKVFISQQRAVHHVSVSFSPLLSLYARFLRGRLV